MEKETEFSSAESLATIQEMINVAKNRFSENGHLYLVWGWTVFVCSIAQFILGYFALYSKPYIVWGLCWVVLVYQVIYMIRKHRKNTVRTYTGEIVGYVWMVFVILMFLFIFLFRNIVGQEADKLIGPVLLGLYGMPTFLCGVILRFWPLRLGGLCCWILSILSVFVSNEFGILLLSVAMATAWIFPGYMLRSKYRKEEQM
jgi:hypothetical protein